MKKLIIFLLLILSVSSFGYDLSKSLAEYINQDFPNLLYGIPEFPEFKINDFSNLKVSGIGVAKFEVGGEQISLADIANKMYLTDFSEDPFDGLIEVWVVGEPSTSTNLTLLIAGLLSVAMFTYKKKYMPA